MDLESQDKVERRSHVDYHAGGVFVEGAVDENLQAFYFLCLAA